MDSFAVLTLTFGRNSLTTRGNIHFIYVFHARKTKRPTKVFFCDRHFIKLQWHITRTHHLGPVTQLPWFWYRNLNAYKIIQLIRATVKGSCKTMASKKALYLKSLHLHIVNILYCSITVNTVFAYFLVRRRWRCCKNNCCNLWLVPRHIGKHEAPSITQQIFRSFS